MRKNALIMLILGISISSLLDVIYNLNNFYKDQLFASIFIISIGIVVYSTSKLLLDFNIESKYFNFTFILFFLYGIFTVLRGWSFMNEDLTAFIRVPYIFWPFLIPLYVYFDKRPITIAFLFKCFYILGLVCLFLFIAFPSLFMMRFSAESIIFNLTIGIGFLFLNANYFSNRKVNVSFVVIALSTISLIYLARRSGLILLLGFLIFGYVLNFHNKSKIVVIKLFPLLIMFFMVAILIFNSKSTILTKNLNERIYEDSRGTVIEMFLTDMRENLIFGKGMNAVYFCPIGGGLQDDGMEYSEVEYRDVIENGYLQLMLSGGIVHIVLFLLILLPAAYNGIFRSFNQFTKACGIMIVLWLFYMFGFGQPALNLGYILVWICVGVCFKKSLRNMKDQELREAFSNSLPNSSIILFEYPI